MSVEMRWDEYHRAMSGLVAEMLGAASYLEEHPDFGTDAQIAKTFREYVERARSIEPPT